MNWILYELGINLFQGFLYTWFVSKNLTSKKIYSKPAFISCGIITAACLSTYIFFPMPEWDTWTTVFVILYSLFFFKDSLTYKLFCDMIMLIVVNGIPGIWFQITRLVLGVDTEMLLEQALPRIIFTLSGNLVLWLTFFTITLFFRRFSRGKSSSALLVLISFLCAFIIDIFFTLHNQYDIPTYYLFAGCAACLSITMLTLLTYRTISEYALKEQEFRYREKLLKEIGAQSESIREMYDSTLKLRHDMNAYIKDLDNMVQEKRLADVPAFFEKMASQLSPLYNTGNISLDSVLTVKLAKLKKADIDFRTSGIHYTGDMNISDIALCSLISNMLDNACEAMIKRADMPGDHYVYLAFSYNPGGLMIVCENPLLGKQPKTEKRRFLSSKEEPYHGLDISIMEKIAHDAGGQFDIVVTRELFRVIVLIPPAPDATEIL